MPGFDDARWVLANARTAGVFPSATAEVGDSRGVSWNVAIGTRTFDDSNAVSLDTAYDLASLTKVIATTTLVMQQVDDGVLQLDALVGGFFPEWRGQDREAARVRDLLEHSSGLAARLVDAPPATPREFVHEICSMPLEYPPRSRPVYSDLGFILLGLLIEQCGGSSLGGQFARIWSSRELTFEPDAALRRGAAPTRPMDDDPRRGRTLKGEVHDNYAAALGGLAGHAGLFGTVGAVGAFARTVLRAVRGSPTEPAPFSPTRMREFVAKSAVPGSSRALGWDTMLTTSSCGSRMSSSAFGHVGFTGTSLWIDPVRDRYFVLLSNRACGGGTVDAMRDVRRAFHDALGEV